VNVSAEIMYEITSLSDLYYAFLRHYNLFQTIEKYGTPGKTSETLQKVIDWLKELIQVNAYEPELKSEIFICYKGQKVQVVAKTKRQKLYICVNRVKSMQQFNYMIMCYRWLT